MEVSENGGTPSHHPFIAGIFKCQPSSYWGTPMPLLARGRQCGRQGRLQKSLDSHRIQRG